MPTVCPGLCRHHQQSAGRQARRHGGHHPRLPRQFPLDLDFRGRLRAGRRGVARKLNYDGYFLEYDTARAGGFEPLRFLPKGNKIVVLGLVTTKSGPLEKKDDVKRRIEEATKYAALDQLCLSPQCGFASTEEGNVLAEDEQWAKLRMIVELAGAIGAGELRAARLFRRVGSVIKRLAQSRRGQPFVHVHHQAHGEQRRRQVDDRDRDERGDQQAADDRPCRRCACAGPWPRRGGRKRMAASSKYSRPRSQAVARKKMTAPKPANSKNGSGAKINQRPQAAPSCRLPQTASQSGNATPGGSAG